MATGENKAVDPLDEPLDVPDNYPDPDDDAARLIDDPDHPLTDDEYSDAGPEQAAPGDLYDADAADYVYDLDALDDPNIPPPSTPDTPSDAAQARTMYERRINDDWAVFVESSHEAFIDHRLAGREVQMVAFDENGDEYIPDPEPPLIPYPDLDADARTVDHDAVVAADEDSTDLRSETDNPSVV